MSRESLRLHATSILELIAWGEAAEQANAGLVAERDGLKAQCDEWEQSSFADAQQILALTNTIAEKDATIAAKDGAADQLQRDLDMSQTALRNAWVEIEGIERQLAQSTDEIERLKAELALRPDRDMFTAWWTQDKP